MTLSYGFGPPPATWPQPMPGWWAQSAPAAWPVPAAPAAWGAPGTAAWPARGPGDGAWSLVPWPQAPVSAWATMAGGEMDRASTARALDLAMLRDQLVGELQAVNGYERDAARASDPRVRARLLEIATDERHHVAELTELIRQLDPKQEEAFRETQG